MNVSRLASARGLAGGLAAGGLGVAALLHPASVLWTALWPLTVLAACHGYGRVLERAAGQRVGFAATVIGGLAVLVTISAVLGVIGVLTLGVELGAIALGLLCCGLAPLVRDRTGASLAAVAGTAAVVVALAAVAIARLDLVIMDGINHTLVIKRLWDTGALDRLPHQLGGQPAAASYFALAPGAWAAALFETSAAPALVAALLFERLMAHRSRVAIVPLCVLAIPILLVPTLTAQWSAVALHAAAFFGLCDAIEHRRTAWHTIACALALVATRHEYAILALPYLVAGVVVPRPEPLPPRAAVALAAAWLAALVAFQIALAVPAARAIVNAGLLLAAWPLARAMLAVLGAPPARGALAVLGFASITFGLALALDAIRPAQHDDAASFAVWFAAVACVASLPAWYEERAGGTSLQLQAAVVILALVAARIAIAPNLDGGRRERLTRYFTEALVTIEYRRATGDGLGPHRDLRALQERVPAGASIGFWGQSAGALDFRRNPIADLSWPRNGHREQLYLTPLTLQSLRQDYVLVERVQPTEAAVVPWEIAHATVHVEQALERIACIEAACVYAVQR